jgi:hypothetical protein
MDAQETSRPIDLAKIAAASEAQTTGVEERLTALEKKMPSRGETRFLRFGAIAGVLGTLISIAGGVLTIYSGTISRAYENTQKDLREFEGYIQQLSTEDQKRAIMASSADNQASKIAQIMAANSASYIAANEAELLLPKLKTLVTPAQFSLLAEAKAIAGDYNAARTYLANAGSLSQGRERAEVLRFEGGILVNSNDPHDRAVAFAADKEALDIVKGSGNYWGASFVEGNIIAQWLVGEAYVVIARRRPICSRASLTYCLSRTCRPMSRKQVRSTSTISLLKTQGVGWI